MASSKKPKIIDKVLTELDRLEIEEAMAGTGFVNRGINTPKTGTFGLNAAEIKPKRTSGSAVSDFLQNTQDVYAKQNIVPSLINTNILKKFGSLSPEQQAALNQQVAGFYNQLKETDWTKYFYSTDLLHKKAVKLVTFIQRVKAEPDRIITAEEFYTNYALLALFEEGSVFTTPGARNEDIIFLTSGEEARAYVRASREPNLFIGASGSGRYLDFTQGSMNTRTEESLKITSFASSIVEQVKTKVMSELSPHFVAQGEKAFLDNISKGSLYPVFLDSLMFALVDTLNLPLGRDYGKGHQAVMSLLANPAITAQMYGESLLQIRPALAEDVKNKLMACGAYTNPFLQNINNLQKAMTRIVSGSTLFKTMITNIFMTFGNLLSYLAQACGTEHFKAELEDVLYAQPNLDDPRKPSKDKLEALALSSKIFNSANRRSSISNPFIQIVFYKDVKPSGSYNYVLQPKYVSGYEFRKEEKEVIANTISKTENWKGFVIPKDLHEYVYKLANNPNNPRSYSSAFSSEDTRGEALQNVYAGEATSTEKILLNFLESIQKEDGSFITDFVAFALIPKLFFQCSEVLPGFRTSCKKVLYISNIERDLYRNIYKNVNIEDDIDMKASINTMDSQIYNDLEYVSDIRKDFLDIIYNYNSTADQIDQMKQKFIILVKNIRNGYWTCNDMTAEIGTSDIDSQKHFIFGLYDPLSESKGDLQLNPEINEMNVATFMLNVLQTKGKEASEKDKAPEPSMETGPTLPRA